MKVTLLGRSQTLHPSLSRLHSTPASLSGSWVPPAALARLTQPYSVEKVTSYLGEKRTNKIGVDTLEILY